MYLRTFIVFILILTVSCGSSIIESVAGDPKRPKLTDVTEWPDSLVIETFYYGGMSPESDKVTIRKDSCIVESHWAQIVNRYAFVPKQSELNDLLMQLNKNSVDGLHLKKTKGITYDAPTSGFSIRLGQKFISIANSASEDVAEKNKGDFRNCYNLLNAYSAKGIEVYKKKVCITIDAKLKTSKGDFLSIIPERGADAYSDSLSKVKDQVCFDFLQGKYSLQIHVTTRDKNYSTKYIASIYPELDVKEDQNLRLVLKNDSTLELK